MAPPTRARGSGEPEIITRLMIAAPALVPPITAPARWRSWRVCTSLPVWRAMESFS